MSKSQTVYIIKGSTGVWEDKREWDVIAYINRANAERHLSDLMERVEKFEPVTDADSPYWAIDEGARLAEILRPLDPHLDYIDYTGVSYSLETILLCS